MILNLIDGAETVFFTLILRSVLEGKPVCDLLRLYVKREKMDDVLSRVRDFAKTKLDHPDLEIVLQEMEQLMNRQGEERRRTQSQGER